MTGLLSPADLESWGWRVPFLLGLLIGPVGFYIRRHTHEAEEFQRAVRDRPSPSLAAVLRLHGRSIFTGFGITIAWTVCTYFFLIYMPTYAVRQLHIPQSTALLANGIGLCVLLVLAPAFGALSDRIGRRPLLLGSAAAIVALTYPLLALLSAAPSPLALTLFQIAFAVLIAAFTGAAPAAMAEICPPQVRSTGVSIAYNFAVTIFGGFAPFIATWLIAKTGYALAPAWYVTAATALSGVMIFALYQRRA
jgi:MHS family proline/betaine transporter-like MFS transporter